MISASLVALHAINRLSLPKFVCPAETFPQTTEILVYNCLLGDSTVKSNWHLKLHIPKSTSGSSPPPAGPVEVFFTSVMATKSVQLLRPEAWVILDSSFLSSHILLAVASKHSQNPITSLYLHHYHQHGPSTIISQLHYCNSLLTGLSLFPCPAAHFCCQHNS